MVQAGLEGRGGFHPRVAHYLGKKYGYTPSAGAAATQRVVALLALFAERLRDQRARGSRYLVGERVSAADIYCAVSMAMFRPLASDVCAMDERTRAVFETPDALTDAALEPVLLEHRDMLYAEHLELPLSL
jgi:glutathione S-transferase